MDKYISVRVPRRLVKAVLVLTLIGAVIAPVAVSASHQFTDVPDTNIFHGDIAWLADNGVTQGCNPPTNDMFCPSDNVTREQMAAFMKRLATNKVVDAATAVTADSATTAGSATTAADADMLGGEAPSAYQTVVAGAQRDWGVSGQLLLTGATIVKILEVQFDVPVDGYAAVTGSATIIGFPTGTTFGVGSWVQLDNTTCAGPDPLQPAAHVPGTGAMGEFDAEVSVESMSGTGVVPVTAGTHTATLCAGNVSVGDSSTVQDAGVVVIVSPLGVSITEPALPALPDAISLND